MRSTHTPIRPKFKVSIYRAIVSFLMVATTWGSTLCKEAFAEFDLCAGMIQKKTLVACSTKRIGATAGITASQNQTPAGLILDSRQVLRNAT